MSKRNIPSRQERKQLTPDPTRIEQLETASKSETFRKQVECHYQVRFRSFIRKFKSMFIK